jgi:hypothetical protein
MLFNSEHKEKSAARADTAFRRASDSHF